VPDERKFCCVVIDGMRCHRSAEFEIRGAGGELDDYTFTCAGHLELVRRLGDVVTPVARPNVVPQPRIPYATRYALPIR
jgi:hypothetical protein